MQEEEETSEDEAFKDLTKIPSIGNLTARALIGSDYASISKLREADEDELASIDHIGEKLAERILEDLEEDSFKDEEENNIFEIRCPACDNFTFIEEDKCQECDETIESSSSVVLPEKGIIENPKKTLTEVEEEILNNGKDAESWFIRGSILESMGANRKALESFDRVIELDPLFDYVWNAKAQVSLKLGETEEAAKAYKLAFDFRKAPKDIADEIEEMDTPKPTETTELEEKDELDKKLDEKISEAREFLGKLDEKDTSDITAELDKVTEEKIEGNKEKALDMVKEVINQCQSLSDKEVEAKEISEKVEKKVSEYSKHIEEIIDKGKNKGIELEKIKESFDELKNEFKSKENQEEMINQFKELKQKAEKTLSLKSNISQIEEVISDHQEDLDEVEHEKRLEKIKGVFKDEDFEKAIDLSSELKNDIESEIKKSIDEGELESEAEEKLAEARKKLSKLRDTDFDLQDMKELLKESNQSKKESDFEKSIDLAEDFIDSADRMIDLFELIEKTNDKIKKLEEKDLIDKPRIEHEVNQYKKLVKIDNYDLAEKLLSDMLEELEDALDEGKMIPPPEEDLDKSTSQIPTLIKEKVRNVKELNNLVERADMEIKVNRKPLKKAIIKIKDLEYKEANEILTDWKNSLIERLNYELGDKLDTLKEKSDSLENSSLQRRSKAILENIERRWDLKAYKRAMETLIYASNFLEEIETKSTKQDKQIYLSSELIEDIERSRDDGKEVKELLNQAEENKDEEEAFNEVLEEIQKKIEDDLKDILDKEIKELEGRLEGRTEKNIVVAISNLVDVKSSLDEKNVEKASWYMREYKKVIEEG